MIISVCMTITGIIQRCSAISAAIKSPYSGEESEDVDQFLISEISGGCLGDENEILTTSAPIRLRVIVCVCVGL